MNVESGFKEQKITLDQIQNFEGKYPKQLWCLFTVEMWERFCFYGMRGVLAIFMVDKLLLSEKESNLKYAAIQAFVYAFTFVGGIFADKILGFKKSLTFGALLMICGNALIAISPSHLFYYGIALTIIGTGFFSNRISHPWWGIYISRVIQDARLDLACFILESILGHCSVEQFVFGWAKVIRGAWLFWLPRL